MRGDKVVETSLPSDLKKPKMVKKDPMDVEMKDAESPSDEKEEPRKDADLLTLEGKKIIYFHLRITNDIFDNVEMSRNLVCIYLPSFAVIGPRTRKLWGF